MIDPADTGRSRGEETILVVDDNPESSEAVAHELLSAGYHVDRATGADSAVDRLSLRAYDVVVSDAGAAPASAHRLQSAAFERDPDVAILVMAATPDLPAAVKCLRDGAFDYIGKPVEPADLRSRVQHAIDRRRRQIRSRRRSRDLEERLAEQSVKINQLKLLSVQALSHALEAKDEGTRNHSARVAHLSRGIAEHMGLRDGLMLDTIALAALLHDVGKIGVPEYVLNKPSALDPAEFEHIKRHPELGEMILKPLLVSSVLAIVRHHHERFDGGGYPDGAAGDDIPLGARIVAVADSYDAMISSRPYRAGMSQERALSVLAAGAGTQWDSGTVSSLLALADRGMLDAAKPAPLDMALDQFAHIGLLFVGE